MRRRIYVWEIPVRLTHWVNVACIILLSFTGYFIANPYIRVSPREIYGQYFMGIVRYVHFSVAFVFIASLLLRTYWAFVGNEWASWRGLFPFLTREGRQAMADALRYYLFLRRQPPEVTGHNALAGMTYMVIVTLYFLIIFTGLALYGVLHPVGIIPALTGWVFGLFSVQTIRWIHHFIMYLLLAFAIHHVYSAWLVDLEEGNGLMSSIFSGFKFMPANTGPDWIVANRDGSHDRRAAEGASSPAEAQTA
ncbi:MAG: Ni/Fe-hydrogenase, b-type cytochrome subunit [Chloroflexi bacterium]|nr:MAG: Ni/Fe-hydrogenase, b-type cytochrome subunit [Chloroflexota bacterium]